MTIAYRSFAIMLAVAVSLLLIFVLSHDDVVGHQHTHGHHQSKAHAQPTNTDLITPIPEAVNVNKKYAKIGWLLFKDPQLSSNGRVSCESCHHLASNGAEPTAVSTGVEGKGTRNSITVFNTSLNYRFFWDGRANSFNDQIDEPVHSNLEMNSDWPSITEYVANSPKYVQLFTEQKLEANEQTIKSMLVEFMSALVTPNAPFDRYLQGEDIALSAQQIDGWELFQKHGCVRCHRGTNIGGGMVMKFGLYGLRFQGEERSTDTGRHMRSNKPEDMYIFRVASLRNVANTAPYFHDGQTNNLEDAIQIMAKSQLGLTLDAEELNAISAFLNSLSAERPAILKEFENESY
ncbi:cytochrome-c peroxidase [Vibrio sp. VPAP30]|uniref:cytochrome-c peroxidase n=1 Tax=Vibrio sp. VPAP30 TaxID=1647102 RepID=UPI000657869C|nr:cytochrome c peroxidase [Vibrio sp. VPAP30]KLN64824.1 cytochrome B6 [Vibrio sp. VPAP30]